jgi:protein-tyrosine phosphatase
MRHMLRDDPIGEWVECDSAGTLDYHTGEAPDPRMSQAMRDRGIEVQGRARQVSLDDLKTFDLILAMDRRNLEYLHRLDAQGKYRDKIVLFGSYCRRTPNAEVPDPYYGGSEGFERVLDMLEDGCGQLVEELRARPNG